MTDQTTAYALIGAVLPLLIAVINQSHWPKVAKALVALAACVSAATLTECLSGTLDWSDWRAALVVIGGAAFASYKVFWKPSDLADLVRDLTTFSRTPKPKHAAPDGGPEAEAPTEDHASTALPVAAGENTVSLTWQRPLA